MISSAACINGSGSKPVSAILAVKTGVEEGGGVLGAQRGVYLTNLIEGHDGGYVQLDARLGEAPDQFGRALRPGIRDRDLDVEDRKSTRLNSSHLGISY